MTLFSEINSVATAESVDADGCSFTQKLTLRLIYMVPTALWPPSWMLLSPTIQTFAVDAKYKAD